MKHQVHKLEKNDLFTQPFSFLRPMDRVKQYDYSAGKIFSSNSNLNFEFDQSPEQILRKIFIEPLISPDKQSAELY